MGRSCFPKTWCWSGHQGGRVLTVTPGLSPSTQRPFQVLLSGSLLSVRGQASPLRHLSTVCVSEGSLQVVPGGCRRDVWGLVGGGFCPMGPLN